MEKTDSFQSDFFRDLQAGFDSGGYATKLTEETEALPASLRVVVANVGKIEQDILFEIFFSRNMDPDEENPYSVLNIAATVFTQIPPENFDELEKACGYCNRRLILGSLGLLRESGALCCRDATVIRHSYPPETFLQLPVDAFMAIASSLEVLIDGLAVVARGMRTTEEAAKEGLFSA
ncbi:hypothetical protein LJC63_00675 [Ruminococcaceae bacterium OttesenSCG-928-L11]|nr:hypothetical protein [Ruminococcaceae bacterium OttesenSCG-928-L11]